MQEIGRSGTPAKGTRVTCEDSDGHQETKVIVDDYCLVTDGRMEVTSMQVYANGTTQITLKKSPQ